MHGAVTLLAGVKVLVPSWLGFLLYHAASDVSMRPLHPPGSRALRVLLKPPCLASVNLFGSLG